MTEALDEEPNASRHGGPEGAWLCHTAHATYFSSNWPSRVPVWRLAQRCAAETAIIGLGAAVFEIGRSI
jgi:hypothetical protein